MRKREGEGVAVYQLNHINLLKFYYNNNINIPDMLFIDKKIRKLLNNKKYCLISGSKYYYMLLT